MPGVCLSLYIYISVCVCVSTHMCICNYLLCMYVCTYVRTYACMYMCVGRLAMLRMYNVCTHTYTYTYTYTYTCIFIYSIHIYCYGFAIYLYRCICTYTQLLTPRHTHPPPLSSLRPLLATARLEAFNCTLLRWPEWHGRLSGA